MPRLHSTDRRRRRGLSIAPPPPRGFVPYLALILGILLQPACGGSGGGGKPIQPPGAFLQSSPINGSAGVPVTTSFTWTSSAGASTYTLELATNAAFTSPVSSQPGLLTTSAPAAAPLAGFTTYFWRVTAVNAGGSVTSGNAPQSFTTGAPLPGGFSLLLPTSAQVGVSITPVFSWTASNTATSYLFELSGSSDFSSPILQQAGLTQTTFIPVSALAEGALYYWRVTASNAVGSTTDSSGPWTFTTASYIGPTFSGVLTAISDTTPPFFGTVNPATAAFTKLSHEGLQGFQNVQSLAFDPAGGFLYGADITTGQLVRIDPTTGIPTAIGFSGFDTVYALAYDSVSTTLYGTDDSTFQLLSFDKTTGIGTPIGSTGPSSFIHGLAWDSSSGVLYGTARSSSSLVTLNTTTGQATAVGPLGFSDVEGLTYDSDLDALLASNNLSKQLLSINKATGAGTAIGPTANGVLDLAWDHPASTLHGVNVGQLITLNKATGQTQSVRTMAFYGYEGLAYDSTSNTLYGVRSVPVAELFVIDPTTGVGRSIGPIGFSNVSSLGFNSTTQTLYAADGFTQTLYILSITTGQGTVVGSVGSLGVQLKGMAYDPGTNTMYGADQTNGALVRVNMISGTVTNIGSFGVSSMSGLGFDPSSGTLYGANISLTGNLNRINTTTGQATKVASFGIPILAMTFDPVTHALLGVCNSPIALYALFRIDPLTGRPTSVGSMGWNVLHSLGFDSFRGILYSTYQMPSATDLLVQVDPSTGAATIIGTVGSATIEALAFDPSTRTLYASDTQNGFLLRINEGTGLATAVATFSPGPVSGMAFHPSTHVLYGVSGNQLYSIDTLSAVCTPIGAAAVGFSSISGLTFDPGSNTLYGCDRNTRKLIQINITTGVGTTVGTGLRGLWDIQFR